LSSNPTDELWETLWSSLYHQGDAYPASYAAVPHLVEIAARQPAAEQTQFWALVGGIAACGSKDDAPLDLQADYEKALERAAILIFQALKAQPEEEGDAIYLLQSLAAVCGGGAEGRHLDGLASEEVQGTCPGCEKEFCAEIVEEGIYLTCEWPPRAAADRTWVEPPAGTDERVPIPPEAFRGSPCSQWLPQVAKEAGHPGLAEQIRRLYGKATCPGCGATFQLMTRLP
jgi:hypothetical protein